jgi:hypothetical protein
LYTPSVPPVPEFMEIYALDSSEAETLYPLPTKYNEAIGG